MLWGHNVHKVVIPHVSSVIYTLVVSLTDNVTFWKVLRALKKAHGVNGTAEGSVSSGDGAEPDEI